MKTKVELKRAESPLIGYKFFKIKAADIDPDGRTVKGYFAAFGNVDNANDLIVKGAFAKSIQERGPGTSNGNKIAFCYQHNLTQPLGVITVLKEDDYGLYFEAVVSDTDFCNDVLTQIKDGTLEQFSIGFLYVWDKMEWDDDLEAFICKELVLMEGSVVTLACNPLANLVGVKSAQEIEDRKVENRKEIDEILRGISHVKAFRIKQLLDEHLALAAAQPLDALKQEKKQAAASDKNKVSFNQLAGIF